MGSIINSFCFIVLVFLSSNAFAEKISVRWSFKDDANSELTHIVDKLNEMTRSSFKIENFQKKEDRDLAFNHYTRYVQLGQGGIPIDSSSLRLWIEKDGKLLQAEGFLENEQGLEEQKNRIKKMGGNLKSLQARLSSAQTLERVKSFMKNQTRYLPRDTLIKDISWNDLWKNNRLIRKIIVKSKRGKFTFDLAMENLKITEFLYEGYPQGEIEADAKIFPIYEQPENSSAILERVPGKLKYIRSHVQKPSTDPFASLRTQQYGEFLMDPFFGETEIGRSRGYWSMRYIKEQARIIQQSFPLVDNSFEQGLVLEGRYATINIHPAALQSFPGVNFTLGYSSNFRPEWKEMVLDGQRQFFYEMIPSGGLRGKPAFSAEELLNRPATRLASHDPTQYMNDGFDEVQVYWAVNALFDSLKPLGFSDPDLSERPFHAFLYDPDIEMRNNAYYTDDTINFTTYSPESQNMARDNPTIWHELGHGVMDRLMGDFLHLADTGGLSEGMADFVAQLVVENISEGKDFLGKKDFRIINNTGFYLTNEVHDDGEAYGGVMNDLLVKVIAQYGQEKGLHMVTDLILEAMRLCRDHPQLTTQEWFQHILFADEIGRPNVREPGQLREVIISSVENRNFRFDDKPVAGLTLINMENDEDVTSDRSGSRGRPITVTLNPQETKYYYVGIKMSDSDVYKLKYPLKVEVSYNGVAIQGAIKWEGEEKGSQWITLNSSEELQEVTLGVKGTCDEVNREDGSCVDYTQVKVYQEGLEKPIAKKRFYIRVVHPSEKPEQEIR